MREMDASLRDPGLQPLQGLGDGPDIAVRAGLVNPHLPQDSLTEEELERLRVRKGLEFELVAHLDKTTISPRKECWYLVDSDWLNKWSAFVHVPKRLQERALRVKRQKERERRRREKALRRARRAQGLDDSSMDDSVRTTETTASMNTTIHSTVSDTTRLDAEAEEEEDNTPPGPLSSVNLVDEHGKPIIPNLQVKKDYRGVPAITYWVFVELYGKDDTPALPRYEVDIYKPEVPVGRLVNIQFKAIQEARIAVGKIRPQWLKWELEQDDDDEEERNKSVCCGLTKEHFEAFIYWVVRCCFVSRKKDGRDRIKYSQYAPMQYNEGDSVRGLDSLHGGVASQTDDGDSNSISASQHSTGSARSSRSMPSVSSMTSVGSSSSSRHGSRSSRGRDRGRDRNSRHGFGGISSSVHSGNGGTNPLHSHDYDEEAGGAISGGLGGGMGYAEESYESGTWLGRTRIGSWLNGFGT